MSFTFIDEATGVTATSGNSMPLTFPSAAAAGDVLVIGYALPVAGTALPSSISQTNVTWVRGDAHTAGTQIVQLWYGVVTGTAGLVATMTLGSNIAGGQTARVWGTRFSCTGTVSVGIAGVGTNGSASTRATETLSPTAGQSALIYAAQRGAGTFSSGPTGGFTALTSSGSTNTQPAYLIVPSTTGTYQTSWTYTTAQSYDTTALVLYESGGGGGGGSPKFRPWFAHR